MAVSQEQLHIDAPELLSRRRRLGDALATGFMWVVYSYLWAPFVSLLAWLAGFEFAYDVMIRAGGIHGLQHAMLWYGVILLAIVAVVSGWSLSNRYRFANLGRRCGGPIVEDDEICTAYGITAEQLESLRSTRVTRLSLSEDGNIERIADVGDAAQRD